MLWLSNRKQKGGKRSQTLQSQSSDGAHISVITHKVLSALDQEIIHLCPLHLQCHLYHLSRSHFHWAASAANVHIGLILSSPVNWLHTCMTEQRNLSHDGQLESITTLRKARRISTAPWQIKHTTLLSVLHISAFRHFTWPDQCFSQRDSLTYITNINFKCHVSPPQKPTRSHLNNALQYCLRH